MTLSILIVNWNTGELARRCIESILKTAPPSDFEIIVVDNASTDGSFDMLKAAFGAEARVKLLKAETNIGFARANNLAFGQSRGDLILCLNPDTEVMPDALAKLTDFILANAHAGVVGARLTNPDGTVQNSVRHFPSIWSSILILLGMHRIFNPKKYLMSDFDYSREAEVDQVMGAALITRRSLIEKIGFFDEGFWLWYEEVDFCKRVRQAGYKVIYYPKSVIIHHIGKSFSQMPPYLRKKTMARSLALYFKKHGNLFEVLLIRVAAPFAILIALTGSLIQRLFGMKQKIKT